MRTTEEYQAMIERAQVLFRTQAMILAAIPFVGADRAVDLARNVAVPVADGDDCYQCAVDALLHRIRYGWICCRDVDGCARAMAAAWDGDADRLVAAAKVESPRPGIVRRTLAALGVS